MTPTEALAALTKLAQQSSGEPTRDEHDGPTCRRCERDFSVDDEDDDDGLCHACAHEICLELPAIVAALAATPVLVRVEPIQDLMTRLEDFCRVDSPFGQAYYMVQDAIEKDRAAVTRAAELRLLERIEKEAKRRYCQDGRSSVFHTFDVVCEIRKEVNGG